MAVKWLDFVRYADTNGYHSDEFREMWAYRDYVIDAFNANMPFDEFTTNQFHAHLVQCRIQIGNPNTQLHRLHPSQGMRRRQIVANHQRHSDWLYVSGDKPACSGE